MFNTTVTIELEGALEVLPLQEDQSFKVEGGEVLFHTQGEYFECNGIPLRVGEDYIVIGALGAEGTSTVPFATDEESGFYYIENTEVDYAAVGYTTLLKIPAKDLDLGFIFIIINPTGEIFIKRPR